MKTDRNILVRYFSGEASEEEKAAIHQWLEEDEGNRKQFINERIRFDASLVADERNIQSSGAKKRNAVVWNALKIASAILLLVGSSYFFSLYFSNPQDAVTRSIHVPAGSRTSFTLPDGTLVWLNSKTTLQYPNTFSKKQRVVELNGEAYFEVTPDKEKTFIVKTGKYNVEVLGTTFNVEAYADKPAFSTALFSGRVKLYKDGEMNSLHLGPGNTADLVNDRLEVTPIGSEIYRWRDGLIIIEDKSFEEIMLLFEKYFGQEIIIQNKDVKKLGYRGKLRIADGVDHALRVLQNDFRFTYKRDIDMNRIYIY